MTCNFFANSKVKQVGFAGQRFKVVCKDMNGRKRTVGWTNDPTGGDLVQMVEKHPVMHSPVVEDLEERTDDRRRSF